MARKKTLNKKNIDVGFLLLNIKKKFDLSDKEIDDLASRKDITIPITIFTKKLGMLESIVLYLHDEMMLSFNVIAGLLHRDYKTVWTSYNKAKKKTKIAKQRKDEKT